MGWSPTRYTIYFVYLRNDRQAVYESKLASQFAAIAQLVERYPEKVGVGGAEPSGSAIFGELTRLGLEPP